MDEMNQFKRSWDLFRRSVSVMLRNKKLLVFPLVTMTFMGIVVLFFFSPIVVVGVTEKFRPDLLKRVVGWLAGHQWVNTAQLKGYYQWLSNNHWQNARPVVGAYFFVMYAVSIVCATFLNVAFYQQIIEALRNHPVSIRGGLKFALSRWNAILMWSAFAGIVGYIIRELERRFGLFGKLVFAILGTAWSVACVFALPVIILDQTAWNPVEVLKKSVAALRKTWGESLIGYAGIKFGNILVTFAAMLWVAGAMLMAYKLRSPLIAAIGLFGGFIPLAVFLYLTSVANQIFRCALYLYASTGSMPRPFYPEMAEIAWQRKK